MRIVLPVTALLFLAACGAQKKTAEHQPVAVGVETVADEPTDASDVMESDRLFFDALKQKGTGHVDEAERLLREALQLNPQNDAIHWELARIELVRNRPAQALAALDRAIELNPSNKWYVELKAELLANTGRMAESAALYGELADRHPDQVDYLFMQAEMLFRGKQYEEALAIYEDLEERLGRSETITREKQRVLIKQNRLDDAIDEVRKLIETDPDNPNYHIMAADLYQANDAVEDAIAEYQKVLEIDPYNLEALTTLADLYRAQGDMDRYVEYSERAFNDPSLPVDAKISILYNYIQFFEERKDRIDDAFRLSDALIRTHPEEAKAHAIAGDLRNLNGDHDQALAHYERSLDLQKDVFTVWQQVFFILADQRAYEPLVERTEEAMAYFPNQPTVHFFNGLGHHQLKAFDAAASAYERGLKMAGNNRVLKAQLHGNLGDVFNSLKRFEASDEQFDAALELEPNSATTLNNYAYFLSLRGERLDDALTMATRANEIEPATPSFLDTKAWVLFRMERFDEALDWQEKAIAASDDPSATLYEHLGDILARLGRVDEAVEAWRSAQEAGGSSELLQRKIDDRTWYAD